VGSHTTAAEPTHLASADATSIHTKDTENTSQTKIRGFVLHIKSTTTQALILPFFQKKNKKITISVALVLHFSRAPSDPEARYV